MIANDQRNLASQLSTAMPVKQIRQTMIVFRNEERHIRPPARRSQAPPHAELFRDRSKMPRKLANGNRGVRQIPLDAHQKKPQILILVLVRVQYIPVIAKDKFRNRGVEPFLIRTTDQ